MFEINTFPKTKVLSSAVVILTLCMLVTTMPQAKAQFVISTWSYPDTYGQGIEGIEVYENSTGSWSFYDTYTYSDSSVIEWEIGVNIRLYVYLFMNSTLTGATDTTDGLNYIRVNVTVVSIGSGEVYSEDDLTNFYKTSSLDPILWYYGYSTVLNFEPVQAETYTVTITYETYY